MGAQALAELDQGMLRAAGFGTIGEVPVQIGVAQFAAEPGVVPEEERKEHQEQREDRNQEVRFPAGTAVGRGGIRWHERLLYNAGDAGPVLNSSLYVDHVDRGSYGMNCHANSDDSVLLAGAAWSQPVSLDANSILVTATKTVALAPTDVTFWSM